MGEPSRQVIRVSRRHTDDAVVRSLSLAVRRPCARPACVSPAHATLSFDYSRREAWIEQLASQTDPGSYDLCAIHVSRTRAPYGWRLRDRRPVDERQPQDTPPVQPADLSSQRTVAVIRAALQSVPLSVPERDDEGRIAEDARDDAGVAVAGDGSPERSVTGAARHRVARRAAAPLESADLPSPDAPGADVPGPRSVSRPGHEPAELTARFATDW